MYEGSPQEIFAESSARNMGSCQSLSPLGSYCFLLVYSYFSWSATENWVVQVQEKSTLRNLEWDQLTKTHSKNKIAQKSSYFFLSFQHGESPVYTCDTYHETLCSPGVLQQSLQAKDNHFQTPRFSLLARIHASKYIKLPFIAVKDYGRPTNDRVLPSDNYTIYTYHLERQRTRLFH